MEKFKFTPKDKIARLPKSPGVYSFKKDTRLLYIGKAANIRERVKNHFHPVKYREAVILPKAKLFNRVKQIGYLKTNSEIEALILEANLIKKYQPKYNVVWRDDKNYFFVGITKENFPQVFITHQSERDPSSLMRTGLVGPFVDGSALKQTLKILRKVFPYRTCKTLPSAVALRARPKHPCLWHQLNRCLAPCLLKSPLVEQINRNQISTIQKESQKNAKNLLKVLQGKKTQAVSNLKKEMKEASGSQNFERAAKIRDKIMALEKVLINSRILELPKPMETENWSSTQTALGQILKIKKKISRLEAYDVSNIQGKEATGSMITFIDGKPNKSQYRKFKIKEKFTPHQGPGGGPNDIAMIKEVLFRRLKHPEWDWPDLILIDGGKAQFNAALTVLKNQRKSAIKSAEISVLALAKKKNELFIENQDKPILLKKLPREIFNLILQMRDEAHRFAISYHKQLREKGLLKK